MKGWILSSRAFRISWKMKTKLKFQRKGIEREARCYRFGNNGMNRSGKKIFCSEKILRQIEITCTTVEEDKMMTFEDEMSEPTNDISGHGTQEDQITFIN